MIFIFYVKLCSKKPNELLYSVISNSAAVDHRQIAFEAIYSKFYSRLICLPSAIIVMVACARNYKMQAVLLLGIGV